MNATFASDAPADFLTSSKAQRSFSLLFAISFTFIMLAQFSYRLQSPSNAIEKAQTMILTWIRPGLPKPVTTETITPPVAKVMSNKPTKVIPTPSKPIAQPPAVTASTNTPSSEKPVSFDSVAESLNASTASNDGLSHKKFDSRAARLAYEESKSDIQKMAEASNKPMSTQKLTKHERFQQAADAVVKPDCVRQGGSILSIFVIAYQAATDHCK